MDDAILAIATVSAFAAGALVMDIARDTESARAPVVSVGTVTTEADTVPDLHATRYAGLPLLPTQLECK